MGYKVTEMGQGIIRAAIESYTGTAMGGGSI